MRLDKLLGELGFGSRNQVKKLIRSRLVTVDGCIAFGDNMNVDPSLQEILVRGEQLRWQESLYLIMNKPKGVVTARSDKKHPTVLDLLEDDDKMPGTYPVGRLDRDTEGLVLLTNNGPLGFRMLHPRYHVSKTYYVEVNGKLGVDAVRFFKEGISFLDGNKCQPAHLKLISSAAVKSTAYVTLSEGKFHQVKKMFLAYGVKVIYLKRVAFGPFVLEESLLPGSYRQLNEEEKNLLKAFLD
ncbi:pseudouridine synthase [Streptococcus ferus]|uniref:Pseudouridine synthase n=1 Tax=Streptococcus ferus TaxID=1345 RepID=A0A2X3W0B0_9STRE|nr:pseudouridine synthase [Streptococcus ferus]SQF40739.1 putative ribosomal small subunit pseudouridine synthase A [Streptococcus ferus]